MAVITDDVDGLDDIDVLQASADAKLCTYFLFVLAFCFASATGTECFYRIYSPSSLCTATDETNSAPCTGTENATPLAILFGKVGVGCG